METRRQRSAVLLLYAVVLLGGSTGYVKPFCFLAVQENHHKSPFSRSIPTRTSSAFVEIFQRPPKRRRHSNSIMTATSSSPEAESLSPSTSAPPDDVAEWKKRLPFKVLGVAGGIGSGKSTACKLLEELGCLAHIDADKVAHSVYEPGNPARSDLLDAFGTSIINDHDGSINRPALGSIVFSDPAKLKQLERIVWPHTQRMVAAKLHSVSSDPTKRPVVIVEAAMLLDADWGQWMDGVWMVTADPDICQRRVVERGGATVEQAAQRIQAQSSRRGIRNLQAEVDRGVVSAVIANNGSVEDLKSLLLSKLDDETAWYS